MSKRILFFFILSLASLAACNNSNSANEASADDMAQFADDEAFQKAHDEPETIDAPTDGQMMTFATPDGKTGSAYALVPENPNGNFLFVIHEWWGLNNHIKEEAARLFNSLDGISVMALDMYDGKVATTQEEAGKYMQAVAEERAEAIIQGAIAHAGENAKIGTIGWCFGGGWSLRSSILAADQGAACVMYYGMPVQEAEKLAPIEADILGIFAQQDGWITPEVVDKFESLAKATGENVEIHQYDAAHAFANPSNPKYDKEAADEANALALAFLKERL